MVNMITPDTQVNVACFGMDAGFQGGRRTSFCGRTILTDEPLIINDALLDERFKDNPNVIEGLRVRAYAGIPLRAVDGTHPGALCLIDIGPRVFTTKEIDLLKDLAAWAEIELNSTQLREATEALTTARDDLNEPTPSNCSWHLPVANHC